MGKAIGALTNIGVARQVAFATAVVATDRVPYLSEGLEFDYIDKLNEQLQGSAGIPDSKLTFKGATGSLEAEVVYTEKTGAEFVSTSQLITAAMGTCTWNVGEGSNEITLADDLTEMVTVALDKGVSATVPWEAVGVFVNTMTLTCDEKESLKATFDLVVGELRNTGSTNAVTDLNTLPNDDASPVLLKDFTFRIGDQADALGAADQMLINGFTVTLNNNLSSQEQGTIDNTNMLDYNHTDPFLALKPCRNGFRETAFEITIPRYAADTFFTWMKNKTDLQSDLLGADPSSAYEFDIIFPRLRVETVSAPIEGPGIATQTVTMRCLTRNSASDMTFGDGVTTSAGELWIETDDERTATMTA